MPLALRLRFTSRMRSRMRSRSFSATAERMVKTSFEMPFAHTSPPRSIMCSWVPCAFISSKRAERIGGVAEHAVELRGDDHVALADAGQHASALRPLSQRDGTGHAGFDENLVDLQPLHHRIADALALLRVQTVAV